MAKEGVTSEKITQQKNIRSHGFSRVFHAFYMGFRVGFRVFTMGFRVFLRVFDVFVF